MAQDKNGTTGYEIPEEVRDFAERSVSQANKAVDGFLSAAERTMSMVAGSTQTVQSSAMDTSRLAMMFTQQNVASAFDLMRRLVKAKSPDEVMSIQSSYLQEQASALQMQAKTMAQSIQKNTKF